MAFNTFSGSNTGNRAFQLNGEILGGVVVSGSGFGGLPVFTGSTDGTPVGDHRKYALSRSFADADATGSVIQALNYLKAESALGGTVTFGNVSNALQASTGTILLGAPTRTDQVSIFGDISSSAGNLIIGGSSIFSHADGIVVTGTISSSAGGLSIGGGAILSTTLNVSGATTLAGNLSSSGGGTFLGGVIATTLEASSSIFAGGSLNVTGAISGTADIAGQELKIQKGATITGSSVFHGAISGGLGATFVEGVIASTLEASSSVFVGGDLNVTGALSGTHFNVSDAGILTVEGLLSASDSLVVDGASIFSSDVTVSGAISSSAGSLIIGGGTTISNTLNVSGTTTLAGNISSSAAVLIGGLTTISNGLILSGNISSSAGAIFGAGIVCSDTLELSGNLTTTGQLSGAHYSITNAGAANFDGAIVNLGGMTTNTLVALGAVTGSGQVLASAPAIGGGYDAANLRVSGTVLNASMAKIEIGASAAANGINQIPYIEIMGVAEDAKLRIYRLQVSGGMFQVTQK